MNKEYNITFTLGDPGGDGHANTVDFHMVSNYSPEEITEAYRKATEKIGWDYVEEFGSEYECGYTLDTEYVTKLLKAGVQLESKYITTAENANIYHPEGSYELDGIEEYVDIFELIIQIILPNFHLNPRNLKEKRLYLLEGAAYGLAYHGE